MQLKKRNINHLINVVMEYNEKHIGKRYVCTNHSMIGSDLYEITVLNFSDNHEMVKVRYELSNAMAWVKCKDIDIVDEVSNSDYNQLKQVGEWAENKIKTFANKVDGFLYRDKDC